MGSSTSQNLKPDTIFNLSKSELCENPQYSETRVKKLLKLVVSDHPLNDELFHQRPDAMSGFMAEALQQYAKIAVKNRMDAELSVALANNAPTP